MLIIISVKVPPNQCQTYARSRYAIYAVKPKALTGLATGRTITQVPKLECCYLERLLLILYMMTGLTPFKTIQIIA
jgi:hypothetical protein